MVQNMDLFPAQGAVVFFIDETQYLCSSICLHLQTPRHLEIAHGILSHVLQDPLYFLTLCGIKFILPNVR